MSESEELSSPSRRKALGTLLGTAALATGCSPEEAKPKNPLLFDLKAEAAAGLINSVESKAYDDDTHREAFRILRNALRDLSDWQIKGAVKSGWVKNHPENGGPVLAKGVVYALTLPERTMAQKERMLLPILRDVPYAREIEFVTKSDPKAPPVDIYTLVREGYREEGKPDWVIKPDPALAAELEKYTGKAPAKPNPGRG